MNDLISRQAAIELYYYLKNVDASEDMYDIAYDDGIRDYQDAIAELPSEKPQWITCSERLPEDDGDYLCWALWDHTDTGNVSILGYDSFAEDFGEWHETFDMDTLGSLGRDFCKYPAKILAWMPIPKPYREDGEE